MTARQVTLAIPPAGILPSTTVVYCTDGQAVEHFVFEMQRSSSQANAPVLIGIHSSLSSRAEEYLLSETDKYLDHERFFVQTVRLWATQQFAIPTDRARSVVFGFSNGGAFAVAAALRHPDRFAAALAFSVPPFGKLPISKSAEVQPSFYLAAGNQGGERSIRKHTLKLRASMQSQQIPVVFHERNADHTLKFWVSEFVAALSWYHRL